MQKTKERRRLNALWFYWILMDMYLPKFDIYQGGYKSF